MEHTNIYINQYSIFREGCEGSEFLSSLLQYCNQSHLSRNTLAWYEGGGVLPKCRLHLFWPLCLHLKRKLQSTIILPLLSKIYNQNLGKVYNLQNTALVHQKFDANLICLWNSISLPDGSVCRKDGERLLSAKRTRCQPVGSLPEDNLVFFSLNLESWIWEREISLIKEFLNWCSFDP